VNDTLSAQTLNETIAVAPSPVPAQKPHSKKPRMTSRTPPRTDASRYDARGYGEYFDGPRYMSRITGTSRATARGARSRWRRIIDETVRAVELTKETLFRLESIVWPRK
jgi:hypothetical protein